MNKDFGPGNRITFEYTHVDKHITMSMPADLTISEILDEFKHFLLAVSYHPDNVKCIELLSEEELQSIMED